MKINVNGSENLWQVEFYYHVNFRFPSFKACEYRTLTHT